MQVQVRYPVVHFLCCVDNWARTSRAILCLAVRASIQCHFPSRALFREYFLVHFQALFRVNYFRYFRITDICPSKILLMHSLKWHWIDAQAVRPAFFCYTLAFFLVLSSVVEHFSPVSQSLSLSLFLRSLHCQKGLGASKARRRRSRKSNKSAETEGGHRHEWKCYCILFTFSCITEVWSMKTDCI